MKNVNEERENIEVEELFDEEYEDNDDNEEDYHDLIEEQIKKEIEL